MDVFQVPEGLLEELLEFYNEGCCLRLVDVSQHREELKKHIGVYSLFYSGNHELYLPLSKANQETSCSVPIYIGKKSSSGRRTGKSSSSNDNNIYARLREHLNSIKQVVNLKAEDFCFLAVPMNEDMTSWGESALIRHFQPVWNQVISGFGIHKPGKGRDKQECSVWDQLHPGRTLAKGLPIHTPLNMEYISNEVHKLFAENGLKSDH